MSNLKLYAGTFTVCLAQFITGMFLPWPLSLIKEQPADDSSFKITVIEASWAESLLKLGTAFGCFFSMFIVDLVGRKISILFTYILTSLSWSLVIWNPSILNLYAARFVGGISSGIILTSGAMYVTEISPPRIRGVLCTCFVLMEHFGRFVGYIIATFGNTDQYPYIVTTMATVQFAIFVWFPESPYYLLRRKQFEAAMDSLMFLRNSPDISEEMNLIVRTVECDPSNNGILSSVLHLISQPGGKSIIFLGLCIMILQAFSGSSIPISYAQMIFSKTNNVELQGYQTRIILATLHLISYLVCISLVDHLGRRPLTIVSTVGVVYCTFLFGVYSAMQENRVHVTNLQILPLVAVLFYVVSVSLGLTSVPFVVLNEIFPIYAKATCVSIGFCINFIWSFIVLRISSIVTLEYNMYMVFWLISALNAFSIFFLVYYLPETKRKSFLQIENSIIRRIT
ncbi:Facilitated trehalose transporter Tret1 [Anthophora retusa]